MDWPRRGRFGPWLPDVEGRAGVRVERLRETVMIYPPGKLHAKKLCYRQKRAKD